MPHTIGARISRFIILPLIIAKKYGARIAKTYGIASVMPLAQASRMIWDELLMLFASFHKVDCIIS